VAGWTADAGGYKYNHGVWAYGIPLSALALSFPHLLTQRHTLFRFLWVYFPDAELFKAV
jgi:hypothetical protein